LAREHAPEVHCMLDSDSELGLGEMGETEQKFGRGGEDICKEYILTWWRVTRTVLETTTVNDWERDGRAP
jgi:hypothetical protein